MYIRMSPRAGDMLDLFVEKYKKERAAAERSKRKNEMTDEEYDAEIKRIDIEEEANMRTLLTER